MYHVFNYIQDQEFFEKEKKYSTKQKKNYQFLKSIHMYLYVCVSFISKSGNSLRKSFFFFFVQRFKKNIKSRVC